MPHRCTLDRPGVTFHNLSILFDFAHLFVPQLLIGDDDPMVPFCHGDAKRNLVYVVDVGHKVVSPHNLLRLALRIVEHQARLGFLPKP